MNPSPLRVGQSLPGPDMNYDDAEAIQWDFKSHVAASASEVAFLPSKVSVDIQKSHP